MTYRLQSSPLLTSELTVYPSIYIFKTNTCCHNWCSFVSLETLDNTFLVKFAQHNLLPMEQFQLRALLNMPSFTTPDITRDSKDSVIAIFKILEKWVQSRNDKNLTALFDELTAACDYQTQWPGWLCTVQQVFPCQGWMMCGMPLGKVKHVILAVTSPSW